MTVDERNERGPTPAGGGRPADESSRRARAHETGGEPELSFGAATPYDEYVRTDVLHALQELRTDEPEERSFLVVSQVMELYFGLLRAEWGLAQRHLRADEVREAVAVLRRSVRQLDGLNASWRAVDWLTPTQFNRFRDQLGVASGFQSWAYRHLEFLLGLKQRAFTRPYRDNPRVHEPLMATFESPSLYDDAVAVLARAGMGIPADVLDRDFGREYRPRPEVEAAWLHVYTREQPGDPLWELAEVLTEVAAGFDDWRHRHLTAVRRAMGAKVGSGGSSGTAWLEKSMTRVVFPELWSARTAV